MSNYRSARALTSALPAREASAERMTTIQPINRLIDKSKNSLAAFTLIELMLVMAIMGLLGTISIGGFRAMRRGMEQSAVMRNVHQFLHNAYQRAVIDRQPTAVYFWNETRREESEDGTESLLVVGRAVAVRRAGRVSKFDTGEKLLIDEFGDLRHYRATDQRGDEVDASEALTQAKDKGAIKMFLYEMNGDEDSFKRSEVSQIAVNVNDGQEISVMLTDPDWKSNVSDSKVMAYGYYLVDAGDIDWQAGFAYGFEFAEITLPNNWIFGGSGDYNEKVDAALKKTLSPMTFKADGTASGNVRVTPIRPGSSGAPAPDENSAKTISASQAKEDANQQNY